MQKFNWLLSLLFLLLSSCTNPKDKQVEVPSFVSGKIYLDKQLILKPVIWNLGIDSGATVYNYELQPGNSNILEFSYQWKHLKDIEDDEVVESFLIEIDSDLDSINVRNKQFNSYKNVYRKSCFSMECNKGLQTETGTLKGKKIDNKSWWFEVEVGMITFQDTIVIGKETRKEI